jgi:hypothetical protein
MIAIGKDVTASRQRLDPLQPLTASSAFPVLKELVAVQADPLPQQPQTLLREGAREDTERLNLDRDVLAAVRRVKMWRPARCCSLKNIATTMP